MSFDEADDFEANGLAGARQNGQAGYLNERGDWAIAAQFAGVFPFEGRPWAKVIQNKTGLPGFINSRGQWIVRQDKICGQIVVKNGSDEIIWPRKFNAACDKK